MNEFDLINRYFKRGAKCNTVTLGIGDDCSLVQIPQGQQLAISVDTLVADVHFPANGDPEQIAERALCVSLSDLAAMGARPLWFTLSLTLPNANEQWVGAFSAGLFRIASQFGCELIGGDTTKGPLAISIQVMGSVEPGKAFTRGGAEPGDRVYVTGNLGDGAAALAIMERRLKADSESAHYLNDRYYRPGPRFYEANALIGHVSAAIDISDGLLADLGHICNASQVGAEIFVESLPLSAAVLKCASTQQQHQWALSGGDDYQLCFTVPQQHVAAVEALIDQGLKASVIGIVSREMGIKCSLLGESFATTTTGYNHFG
ncbi:thiamine-phosphate kinase [Teredinibacter purpureus]|uniref:thiamine-phosphate kinase n=1 Tax=Teredinibacter purpureus TaxID=2731756 RepID=UPI0005F8734C|nr:thiamine-phosphate kinase [Teredinibacter purpureus]